MRHGALTTATSRQTKLNTDSDIILTDEIRTADLVKELKLTRSQRINGFCIDTGAPHYVIERIELNRFLSKHGVQNRKILPAKKSFRFADTSFKFRIIIHIQLNTPLGAPINEVHLYIVEGDIHALLGMDLMEKEGLTPRLISQRLARRWMMKIPNALEIFIDDWYFPIMLSRSNHLYMEIHFTLYIYF